jgi:hypothetical protein
LPVYEQPLCPGDGYIWVPGYWDYDPDIDDYFWVPGTWVLAPEVGFLWTPGWWGWGGEAFIFNVGYWGPVVGFYGGINYGFGYFGEGYEGGRWEGGHFYYNAAVNNVDVNIVHNVYKTTVVNRTETRVSFNGPGGIQRQPTPQERAAERERHIPPVPAQMQHVQTARTNPELRASRNQGRPPVAATARPGDFHAAVPAREAGGPYHPPANRAPANRAPANRGGAMPGNAGGARPSESGGRGAPMHARDLPPMERPASPNTGNPKLDQKYQQQQQKLAAQQDKERQKLVQQQERDHQQAQRQQQPEARQQQMEQRHQQQTQQLQERHTQQQQQLQQRQAPRESAPRGKGRG